MKENSKRNYKLIISIIVTILVLGGTTYAAWYYLTEKTHVVMNIDGDRINFNAGEDLTVNNMMPVYTMEDGVSKEIEVYQESTNYTAGINLFMNLKAWPIQLSDNSFRWALYKNDKYMTSGSFVNKKQGDTIKLTSVTQKLNTVNKKDTYKLYMWIDAYQESNINMMNKSFTISIYGQASFYDQDEQVFTSDTVPNAPELAEGMIPIKYNYLIDEWQKADSNNTDNEWYNYNEQYWANAVMVTSDSRDKYMNAEVGTTVLEDDILAYYVWIPRYRYLLFNVNSTKSVQEIQVEFQKITDEISDGDENGEWLTHPAFWWDENSDGVRDSGEELSGIWVGKFETGGTSDNPLIKPNIISLRNVNVSGLFNINRKFGTNVYLIETGVSESDSHMMKNMEWGVVAYLSHSRYGINANICRNNSSWFYTGRSGGTTSAALNNQGTYTYNDFVIDSNGSISTSKEAGTGTCASTTGNISGIYDMSGGAWEYVMGVMKTSSGTISYGVSGFNASTMPQSKYYDLYDYGTDTIDYTRRLLGDATGETRGWYNANAYFISTSDKVSWFNRGGGNNSNISNSSQSIFGFNNYLNYNYGHGNGGSYGIGASRSVIVLP